METHNTNQSWKPILFLCGLGMMFVVHACLSPPLFINTDSIRFPLEVHQEHMDKCALCHADLIADAIPDAARQGHEESCFACHDDWRSQCDRCHEGNPGVRPDKDRNLIFSHRDHLSRLDGSCDRCHSGAHSADVENAMPAHEECFSCHEMQTLFDELKCQSCHKTLEDRRLLPMGNFKHSVTFLDEHGEYVQDPRNQGTCAQCHEGPFCLDCHFEDTFILPSELMGERVQVAFIHPGDFIHRHASLARTEPDSCVTCHSPSTCEDCHTRSGIGFLASETRQDGFSFHGPGVNDPSSRAFHGRAARRDILACASCHDNGMDSNCIDCHRVGGAGGNPHPPGFRSSLSRAEASVCRACHIR